ncbi:transcription regulator TrmB [Subdoligranulum sp. CAG:314]|nr:transcription regulator TrmB [Subdoligranulum sp. CAG:314]
MNNQNCDGFCSRLKALATGSSRLFMAASGRVEGCDDSETKILFSLGSDGYATEAELIEKIGLPRKKFYACVKSLVEKGFVARFRSPIKRNAIYLELTDDALLSVAKDGLRSFKRCESGESGRRVFVRGTVKMRPCGGRPRDFGCVAKDGGTVEGYGKSGKFFGSLRKG